MSRYIEKNKRTKALITEAFINIMSKKTFDTITIGDITAAAKINRGTFYLHYLDKFDLLDKVEQQLFTDIGNHLDELQARYATPATFAKEQELLAASLFRSIATQSPLLKIFLSDHGRAGFHLRFKAAFAEKVQINLSKNDYYQQNLNVPLDYFIAFITSAFLGLIEQWLQNDLDQTPMELTTLYINIIAFIQKK
ncbi:TetR/AcrR family transcriptional regulator C-terminal domain-containing protein [Brochothrix campestris]